MRKVLFWVFLLGVIAISVGVTYAQDNSGNNQTMQMPMDQQKQEAGAGVSQPQEVGNKICPVSGDKINEKTKATYEYEGKVYNFCCSMCIDAFKKEPQKYIKKVEEEMNTGSKAENY